MTTEVNYVRSVIQVPYLLSKLSMYYGMVPKGLLTFLGSHYKEVAKTTPETLVYRFERQTAREKSISFFEKHCVLDLACMILSQKPSDRCI